ncbi:MAG: glycogen synthase GlgA [Deltaproteobacteria bacterium]|nr:glycogen synthase GlgA [Deltaproteobacteria bacterium]
MKLLVAVSEMVPYAKTGGLGDVAGALPDALLRRGCDVRVFLPCYRIVRERTREMEAVLDKVRAPLGGVSLEASILETRTEQGVPVYVVEREDLFDRPNLYGTSAGDYYDNLERFAFFCRAALLGCAAMGFAPDVVHCHDWQTGLIPPILGDLFPEAGSVFTIHNLGYQGLFPADRLPATGLSADRFFHPEGVEYWGRISLLKAGIVYADAVTTVSPTYAEEIQTPEFGMGMEGVLRSRRDVLSGILNGADYARWDPVIDPHLPARYGPGRMAGKARCKKALIREVDLDTHLEQRPVIGVVSRLDRQKGLDLLIGILDELFSLDVGLVVLGTGDAGIEEALRAAGERFDGRMALRLGFDEPLAHRITAGSDLFLVPSRYEPCGLTQMHAMKYGTVPVVRATGGLKDTVSAYDPGSSRGTGFKFFEPRPRALLEAVRLAVSLFERRDSWERLRKAVMEADFSWDESAARYMALFEDLRTRRQPFRSGSGRPPARRSSTEP